MTTTRSSSSATSRKSAFPCTVLGLKPNLWTSLNCLPIGMAHLSAVLPARVAYSIGGKMWIHHWQRMPSSGVEDIAARTMEYMTAMENALQLEASGLEGDYRILADFNGTVLAGSHSKYGVQFVTWDWDYERTGVTHGHYFMENYDGAKQDFVTRSGLIHKEQLFSPEQMTEIYRCCADSVDGEFFELTDKQEEVIRSVQQQIEVCVPDLNERIRQQEEALEQASQEQTM